MGAVVVVTTTGGCGAGVGVTRACTRREAATRPVTIEKIITGQLGMVALPVAIIDVVRQPPAEMMKSERNEMMSVSHDVLFTASVSAG